MAFFPITPTPQAHDFSENRAVFDIVGPQNERIGWQLETVESLENGWQIRRERRMSFVVDGHDPVTSDIVVLRRFNAAQQLRELVISGQNDGKPYRFAIRLQEGNAVLEAEIDGRTTVKPLALPPGIPVEDPDSLIRRPNGKHLAFDPATGDFAILDTRQETRTNGDLVDFRIASGFPTDIWLHTGPAGDKVGVSVRPLLGSPIRFVPLSGQPTPTLDGRGRINHQLVPSPFAVSGSTAKTGKIRYLFGVPETLASFIPQTGEQAIRATDDGVRLDICGSCGPGLSTDPADLARWRQPTAWMQSDAPDLMKRVRRVQRMNRSDDAKMQQLGRITRQRLINVDLHGHASALAAWRNRAGDCTEDAVLYATLARAAGIPALVASGIVYTRERYHGAVNAFVPHSWVVAWVDGKWKSYDITLGGFDATHIALTVDEGDARSIAAATQIAGVLEWNGMAEVRQRPVAEVTE